MGDVSYWGDVSQGLSGGTMGTGIETNQLNLQDRPFPTRSLCCPLVLLRGHLLVVLLAILTLEGKMISAQTLFENIWNMLEN